MYSSETFSFLSDLKSNNNKPWFEANRKRYDAARGEHLAATSRIIDVISTWDESLKGVDAKKCIFRINRDIRFSKDKSPYKNNFGAYFSADRKEWARAGYYLHVEPGASFIAGGVYSPAAEHLRRIRQEIDYNTSEFTGLLQSKEFIKWWGKSLAGEKLKKAPKDYPADHPAIEYLKQKDFIVKHELKDTDMTGKNLAVSIEKAFRALHPLNNFLDRVWD